MDKKKVLLIAATILAVISTLFFQYDKIDKPHSEPQQAERSESTADSYVSYTFANEERKQEHFEKHGIAMGFDDADEYEKYASDVVNNPDCLHKIEDDGDDVYYLEATNELVIVSTRGYIRTYFLPDDGKAYFDRT